MNKIRYLSLLMLLLSSIVLWGNSAPPSSPYMRTQDGETLLTVVADPPEGGTVSGGGSYVAGTQVNLRATANTNFQFVNWTLNGEEISTERNFTYTKKDADETLIAHFVYNPKDPNEPTEPVKQTRLDVVADPMDGGSVSGGGKFATGAQVSLKASPNTGFVFVNWTRNGEKVSTERNFTYSKEDGDETLIAHFAYQPGNPNEPNEPDIKPVAKKYKLTVVSEEGGTNVSGSGEYVSGTQVTLSVSISTGFSFQGWYNESDSLLSTSTRFSYTTQERDETITARIKYTPNNPSEPEEPNLPSKPKPHKITVLAVPSDGGSVSVGSETVVEGEQTRVRATANTGFVFKGWYVADTLFQTAADFYYTMGNKDISMEARFVYNPSSPGEPEETGKKSYTLYLTSVRGLPGRTVQYPIYLSSQDSLTNIQFNITFPIGLTPDIENIKLSGKAQGYTLSCKEVEVTTDETQSAPRRAADRETAYQFTLTDGKLPACNTRLMVIDVAISENVTDTTQQVKINQVTVTDTEGTNTTASTRNGAVVMNESSGDGTYYYLTLISTGSGQATVNSRTVRNSLHIFDLLEGSSTNVYFTPDNGYHIDKVTLDEVDITDQVLESSRYLFSNVNADATLTVMFAEGSSSAYDLTLKTDGHGKISYNGIDVGSDEKVFSVSHGAHVEMIIMPDEGYHVKQVLLNDTIDVTLQVAEGQYIIESMTTANKVFVSFEESPTVATPIIVCNDNKVAVSTTTENAVIYYTLDGSEPTNQSTLYTDSITVERNCIIKAIALRENYYPSQVATFEVDWFKVADVTFAQNGRKVALATTTANASIYYKIGEGDLDVLYTDMLTLDGSCTIRATAKRDGYNDADVTSYEFNADSVTVAKPIFARKDSIVTISTTTPEAVIHYTLDGTLPTGSSAVYEKPIVVEQNGVIKAIALRENWFDSEIASLTIDRFKCEKPVIAWNGDELTASTTTEDAIIQYTLTQSGVETLLDQGGEASPLKITVNQDVTIHLYAVKTGWSNSDTLVVDYPYTAWSELLSAIQECTVVVAQCGGNSKVDQQKVQTLQNLCVLANTMYNERVASSNEILSRCNELNALAAELLQQLNAIDFVYDSVGVLTINGGTSVAEALEAAGGRAEVAKTITAIVWNNTSPLTNSDLQGLDNPNMLIYVAADSLAPDNRDNVVVNGQAKNIVLTDTKEGNGNFYCPQAFTAEKVSYAREFRQQTQVGVSRGWESIALPFNVQTIMHEKQGVIAPFGNSASTKHFWLRRLGDSGLTQATAIEANVPYVISMPNDEVNYAEEFNLSGRVTFTAQEVMIPVTEPVTLALADSTIKMMPAFQSIGRASDVWAINVGETRGKYFEGSVFERDYREVRPFEAYTVHTTDGSAPRFVPVMEIGGTTDIEDVRGLMSDDRGKNWYDLNGRRLQSKPSQKGVYLHDGRKVVIR